MITDGLMQNFSKAYNKFEYFTGENANMKQLILTNPDYKVYRYPEVINIVKSDMFINFNSFNITNIFSLTERKTLHFNIIQSPISLKLVYNISIMEFINNNYSLRNIEPIEKILKFKTFGYNWDYNEIFCYYNRYSWISSYVMLLFASLTHYKNLNFSMVNLSIFFITLSLNVKENILMRAITFCLIEDLLSIQHKFNPIFQHICRERHLKNSFNPRNCLVKLFQEQRNKFLMVKITNNHIEKGKSRISRKLFCKLYFSNVMLKTSVIESTPFERMKWIFSSHSLSVLQDDIIKMLFNRQGYVKDFTLFEKILKITNISKSIFKANCIKNNIKITKPIIKLNYYILLHLEGKINRETKACNITLIDFNYSEVKRKTKEKITCSKLENNYKENDLSYYLPKLSCKVKTLEINAIELRKNNLTNMLMSLNFKNPNFTNKTIHENYIFIIFYHKICKKLKFLNFCNNRLKIVTNIKKVTSFKHDFEKTKKDIESLLYYSKGFIKTKKHQNLYKNIEKKLNVGDYHVKNGAKMFAIKMKSDIKKEKEKIYVGNDKIVKRVNVINKTFKEQIIKRCKYITKNEHYESDKVHIHHKKVGILIDVCHLEQWKVWSAINLEKYLKSYKKLKLNKKKIRIDSYIFDSFMESVSNSEFI